LLEREAWKAARGAGDNPAVEESPGSSCERRSRCAATGAEIRAMLEDAGFVPRMLEVRTFVSVFRDVAQIIDFLQATTYGELAAGDRAAYYAGFRDAMEAPVAGEYADRVGSDGIRLERYILLAIADKR
jgi:hypothetical protein